MNCEKHLSDRRVLVAYGLEPGGARRMQWENRIHKELAPTLRENMGDNQAAVIVISEPKVFDARGNGGVRGGQPWQESWKGCADTMGNERDAGHESRSDAVRVVGIDLYNQCMTGGGIEDLE